MKIYGLAYYTYDWYEWETVEAVSFDRGKLVEEYQSKVEAADLVDSDNHEDYSTNERSHYMIIEIPFLGEKGNQ